MKIVYSPLSLFVRLAVLLAIASTAYGDEPDERCWAIQADTVTENGCLNGWLIVENGHIKAVGAPDSAVPKNARIIKYDGYIFPGLVDTHNHVHWNSIPKWSSGVYKNRYKWQEDPEYIEAVNNPFYNLIREQNIEPESVKYGEIRALIGGTTIIQSSYKSEQPKLLIKNLDSSYHVDSYVPDIRRLKEDQVDALNRVKYLNGLNDGSLKRLFLHVGEGKRSNREAQDEFQILNDLGLMRPGVVVIHGVPFGPAEFSAMKTKGMYLVWSPRSNWTLYRETTNIPEAVNAGLIVALAPDWSISGSDNLLEEMKFAQACFGKKLSSRDLFLMSTINAAKVAGINEHMGKLEAGYDADFFLAPKLAENTKDDLKDKPFDSLLRTYPRHIHLVFVDGKPIYGDTDELIKWTSSFDTIKVENTSKGIITTGDASLSSNSEHFESIIHILQDKLPKLAPLLEY